MKGKRTCPECGNQIIGRIDKKFCSDYCRNTFNNKMRQHSNNLIRNINNILRKNRRILEKIAGSTGKAKTTKEKLYKEGFDFEFYTSIRKTKKGNEYTFCYDYGILPLGNDWYLVVKQEV